MNLFTTKMMKSGYVSQCFYQQPLAKNTQGCCQKPIKCNKKRDQEFKRNIDSKKMLKKPYLSSISHPPSDSSEATNKYPNVFDDVESLCANMSMKHTKGGHPKVKATVSLPEILEGKCIRFYYFYTKTKFGFKNRL